MTEWEVFIENHDVETALGNIIRYEICRKHTENGIRGYVVRQVNDSNCKVDINCRSLESARALCRF